MFTFSNKIDNYFYQQANTTNSICVSLYKSPKNIFQLHYSKKYFIKPHVFEDSLKRQFALHQYFYNF